MAIIYTEVEVDVDLSKFDDVDISEEYEKRGLSSSPSEDDIVDKLHYVYSLGHKDQIDALLQELFYVRLGRIV